jgi:hypothetical protein
MMPIFVSLAALIIVVVVGLVLEIENELAVGLVPVRIRRDK